MANTKSNFVIGYRPQTAYSEVSNRNSSASMVMAERSLLFKDTLIKKKILETNIRGRKIDTITADMYKPYQTDHASTYTAEFCKGSNRPKTAVLKRENITTDLSHIKSKNQSNDEIENQESNEMKLRKSVVKDSALNNSKQSPAAHKITQVNNLFGY